MAPRPVLAGLTSLGLGQQGAGAESKRGLAQGRAEPRPGSRRAGACVGGGLPEARETAVETRGGVEERERERVQVQVLREYCRSTLPSWPSACSGQQQAQDKT